MAARRRLQPFSRRDGAFKLFSRRDGRLDSPLGGWHGLALHATIRAWNLAGPDEGHDDEEHESAYELLQRGQALLERRHYAQAAIVLERADRLEPRRGSILEALGRAYFNSGQAERARGAFEAPPRCRPVVAVRALRTRSKPQAVGPRVRRPARTCD